MTGPRSYLDWNATAPLRPEAREAMLAALDECGNPSSVHAEGRRARAIVETARREVAALVGAEPHNVVFTASATEAANHVLTPHWRWSGRATTLDRLYVSAIEHPCVLAGGRFAVGDIATVPVTASGIINLSVLEQTITSDTQASHPLLAPMAANNETGILQPVREAAAIVHAAGGLLVCDAVQAAGRVPVDITELGADALFISAHKLGGPKGAGALILANEAVAPAPLLTGGGQERRQRAGTENVAAIAGFGAAAAAAKRELVNAVTIAALRDRLEDGARHALSSIVPASSPFVHSMSSLMHCMSSVPRLPNTALVTLPGDNAETLVIQLDLAGISVSAGAACSSGKVKRSHVLDAMGIAPEIAAGSIRVSLGATTTGDDVDRFLAAWSAIVGRHARRQAA